MAVFAVIGAIDYILGNRFGVGEHFEKGASMLTVMFLSMVGMILLAPVLADLLLPLTTVIAKYTPFDPSIISGMILSNDMGGAPLSISIANDKTLGNFNGLVVASMLGSTITYLLPFALSTIEKKHHTDMFLGMLCGIGTVPLGCFVSGVILKIPFKALIIDLVPVIVFSALVILGLMKFPALSVKIFSTLGKILLTVIIAGLTLGVLQQLTGIVIIRGMAPLGEGVDVIVNTTCIMMGAFPLVHILSKVLNRPLSAIGKRLGFDNASILGFLGSSASFSTCVPLVPEMNKKGRIANLAFAVSGAFSFGGHLAFTMSINPDYVWPMIIGKMAGGFSAVAVAILIYNKMFGKEAK